MTGALGLESGIVRVVPYSPAWPALFDAERERLAGILVQHDVSLEIEHVGSTAVPGLDAKPVLDMLAGARDGDMLERALGRLQTAGYSYRGEQGIPGRHFFRRGDPRQYHVHLTLIGSGTWRDHLAFRDYLRAHPDAAAQYALLKHELATRHPRDREAYIDGKTVFVQAVLGKQGCGS